MKSIPEIRREKIFISSKMTIQGIREKYDIPPARAWVIKKRGFFVKNYSRKQIICDPENFNPAACYNTAWKVFWKNFSLNKVALSIKEDLVQEAVTRMYELSGKDKWEIRDRISILLGCSQRDVKLPEDLAEAAAREGVWRYWRSVERVSVKYSEHVLRSIESISRKKVPSKSASSIE